MLKAIVFNWYHSGYIDECTHHFRKFNFSKIRDHDHNILTIIIIANKSLLYGLTYRLPNGLRCLGILRADF